MRMIGKFTVVTLAAAFALATTAFAAGEFEGTWKVKDTKGKAFEIVLAADGTATSNREKDMSGTWKEEGGAAVITWKTGWTTKIAKDGSVYKKTAYKGAPSGDAANSSDAEKVK
jgi:hypothetical protein